MFDVPGEMDNPIAFGPTCIAEAATRFGLSGFAVILAANDDVADFLPEPLDTESFSKTNSATASGFMLRRRIARALAARITDTLPDTWRIEKTALGAPRLAGRLAVPMPGMHLSFASRNGASLIGVSRAPIGLDIETPITAGAIPWNVLGEDEARSIRALEPAQQELAFVRLWAGKEAVLKILGVGLTLAPEHIRISSNGVASYRGSLARDSFSYKLPIELSWNNPIDVFHNTFIFAIALLKAPNVAL